MHGSIRLVRPKQPTLFIGSRLLTHGLKRCVCDLQQSSGTPGSYAAGEPWTLDLEECLPRPPLLEISLNDFNNRPFFFFDKNSSKTNPHRRVCTGTRRGSRTPRCRPKGGDFFTPALLTANSNIPSLLRPPLTTLLRRERSSPPVHSSRMRQMLSLHRARGRFRFRDGTNGAPRVRGEFVRRSGNRIRSTETANRNGNSPHPPPRRRLVDL